jgi:hypothetical protein
MTTVGNIDDTFDSSEEGVENPGDLPKQHPKNNNTNLSLMEQRRMMLTASMASGGGGGANFGRSSEMGISMQTMDMNCLTAASMDTAASKGDKKGKK